jgi:hypothetical protein
MLRAMRIVIREIHAARAPGELNDEWFVIENAGDRAFSTAGCTVAVARGTGPGKGGGKLRALGTLDPGFLIQPGERVRLITGNPAKKAHGKAAPRENGERDYHLFLGGPILQGAGTVVAMALHQHEVARAVFDPASEAGVAPDKTGG